MNKISTEINGKEYILEVNRTTLMNYYGDAEFRKIQKELIVIGTKYEKDLKDLKEEDLAEEDIDMSCSMVATEIQFLYALKKNHPDITREESNTLLDCIFDEDGTLEYINEELNNLYGNFIKEGSRKPRQFKKL